MPPRSAAARLATNRTVLDEPKAGALTLRYRPDGGEVYENPPRFCWLPTLDESSRYVLRVSPREDYPAEATVRYEGVERNFFTPDRNDVFAGFRTCALHV